MARGHRNGSAGKLKLAAFASLSCVLLALTFLFGVLVGREWARGHLRTVQEVEKKPSTVAKAGPRELASKDRPSSIQEKLTFYQTLPAPLSSTPRESAKKAASAPKETQQKSVTPKSESRSASPESGESTATTTGPAPPPGSQFWTIQVSAYRSRGLAEELKQSLRSAGYDAYLMQVGGEDGKSRYRVRVGSYPARVEADRVAERLKTERSLSPFVVPKS